MQTEIHGWVLLDKPLGLSSNRALQKVKHTLGVKKAGHTGSLDPAATGMLPLGIGRGTRFSQYLLEADKTYEASLKLGEATDTGDVEGEITDTQAVPELSEAEITKLLSSFLGTHAQLPPMYSALKHKGQPLYKLAREGKTVERTPRNITVYEIELLSFENNTLSFKARCSKGTYIRTLGEDIAKAIGTCGHLSGLRRTSCAGFTPDQMVPMDSVLDSENPAQFVLPIESAFLTTPKHVMTHDDYVLCGHGKTVDFPSELNGLLTLYVETIFVGVGVFEAGVLIKKVMV